MICNQVVCDECNDTVEVVMLATHTEVEVGMETKDSCHLQPLKEEQQHQKQLLDINAEPVKRGRGRPKGTKRKHKARYNYFVENKDDENEASTSTSSVCSFSTAQMDEPGFPSGTEEKTKEPSKERLVEFDKQWYKVIIFFLVTFLTFTQRFNGNVFSCTPCNFRSNSLVNLKVHVKEEHNTSLSRS